MYIYCIYILRYLCLDVYVCMCVCIYAIRFIHILYIVSCRKASSHLPSYLEGQGLLNALGTNLNPHLPWYRFSVGCMIVWLFVCCFVWRSVTYPYTHAIHTTSFTHRLLHICMQSSQARICNRRVELSGSNLQP